MREMRFKFNLYLEKKVIENRVCKTFSEKVSIKYPGIYSKYEFMLYFPKMAKSVLILTKIAQIMPKKQ